MKKCKNQLLAALIASTMAMSMTACGGTSAETTKLSETAVTEKATETESESETAEAKEYDLDDVKDYVEGIDDKVKERFPSRLQLRRSASRVLGR